jgi:predicted acetyltransferase
MPTDEEVTLDLASLSDAALIANLLQLYLHDLSDTFPSIELGVDGRFSYEKLPLYWSEPERRFPLLIRHGGEVGGFALITRGSPASENPDVFDIAEFFVIRRHRRSGVGRRAAFLLWNRFPGSWTVRVSEGNRTALPFWTGVIEQYTGGTASQRTRPDSPHAWRVFSFVSPQTVPG